MLMIDYQRYINQSLLMLFYQLKSAEHFDQLSTAAVNAFIIAASSWYQLNTLLRPQRIELNGNCLIY